MFLSACGKVSQPLSPEQQLKSVDFVYSAAVRPQSVAAPNNVVGAALTKMASNSKKITALSFQDTQVYAAVFGYNNTGTYEVSWGKGELYLTSPTDNYRSRTYDKNDFQIEQSSLEKTKLTYDLSKQGWQIESKKIKNNFDHYLIAVYSQKNPKFIRWVDHNSVSGNSSITIPDMSDYDSFLAALFITSKSATGNLFEQSLTRQDVTRVFTDRWFNGIGAYQLPDNQSKKFDVKHPVFVFNRTLEVQLLKLLSLCVTDDFDEAKIYIQSTRFEGLSRESVQGLLRRMDELKIEKRARKS